MYKVLFLLQFRSRTEVTPAKQSLFAAQTTVNLPLGIIIELITLIVLITSDISSLGNIHTASGIHESLVRAQFGEPRKKQVERLAFFYPIRRIGMESPAGCMESVAKRRHGILFARPPFARRHFVLCSVFDGTLAEQSALAR